MRWYTWMASIACPVFAGLNTADAASPWGKQYFPNVPLITHEGRSVRFFDDLIEGRIVAVNFIYTHCPDSCPLETAQLVAVQNILGERLGRDVFFYSISIDPDNDTPEVLAAYRERFGARWTFLTGREDDIVRLRKKLGLYIEDIQDGSSNHNVNMIIGNQATGRWMKRSPFENPYVLADQLGNWLDGWRSRPVGAGYASAPKLRGVSRGERLFRTRCATCHSLIGNEPTGALGPDLLGVTGRRETAWLLEWLRAPDQMLKRKDPIAVALFEQYNRLAMPNLRLREDEARALLDYIDDETRRRVRGRPALQAPGTAPPPAAQAAAQGDVVAIANAWVRELEPGARAGAGYATLVNLRDEDVTLVRIESNAFERVEMHEMALQDGLPTMREMTSVVLRANGQVRFEPRGRHLMLIGPKVRHAKGETIDLTLSFGSGRKQTVSLKVGGR